MESPSSISLLLGALLVAVAIAKYGLALNSSWRNLFEIAGNWRDPSVGSLAQPPQDYILSNSSVPVVCGLLGLTSQGAYLTVQVILTLFALVVPFLMPAIRERPNGSRLLYVMLAGGPVAVLLITNIGSYDALCVAAAGVAVLARNRVLAAGGWFAFSLGHFTLAAIALVAYLLFLALGRRVESHRALIIEALWAVGGVCGGAVVMGALVASWGGATNRLDVYLLYPFSYYWNSMLAGLPLSVFTVLGVGWVVLFDKSLIRLRDVRVLLTLALVSAFALPLTALDQTRIPALVMYPVVLAWASGFDMSADESLVRLVWRRYAVAASVVPVIVVLGGGVGYSGWTTILGWRASL